MTSQTSLLSWRLERSWPGKSGLNVEPQQAEAATSERPAMCYTRTTGGKSRALRFVFKTPSVRLPLREAPKVRAVSTLKTGPSDNFGSEGVLSVVSAVASQQEGSGFEIRVTFGEPGELLRHLSGRRTKTKCL